MCRQHTDMVYLNRDPRKEINRIIMCDMYTKWMIKITIMISLKRLKDGNRRLPYGTIRTIPSGMWRANIQKANENITDGCLRWFLPLRRSFPDFPPRSFYASSLKISKKELYMPADSTRMGFCFSGGRRVGTCSFSGGWRTISLWSGWRTACASTGWIREWWCCPGTKAI